MDDDRAEPSVSTMLIGMAICMDCEREMTTAASCTVTTLHMGDTPFPMARHRRSETRRR